MQATGCSAGAFAKRWRTVGDKGGEFSSSRVRSDVECGRPARAKSAAIGFADTRPSRDALPPGRLRKRWRSPFTGAGAFR